MSYKVIESYKDGNGSECALDTPIFSWCDEIENWAMEQAINITKLPFLFKHFALMPDGHFGYGMPIGGVAALENAVSVNMVGVDIGCGMSAIQTNIESSKVSKEQIDHLVDIVHRIIPCGEGKSYQVAQDWVGFDEYHESVDEIPGWFDVDVWELGKRNLGTLGGGNHFIEFQEGNDGFFWIMLHSGSRNLGYKIAQYYHNVAKELNGLWHSNIPTLDLAFFPAESQWGIQYVRDMNFALKYAFENRRRMMEKIKYNAMNVLGGFGVVNEINIHHNYASLEHHMGKNVWVHRKGATSARKDQLGIIPGSMGANSRSYIVRGKGNPLSFMSCSHGAGRQMGRKEASRRLTIEEANESMNGVSFRGFKKSNGAWDLGEAEGAYKPIDQVMAAQQDLVEIVTELRPRGVVKG